MCLLATCVRYLGTFGMLSRVCNSLLNLIIAEFILYVTLMEVLYLDR